MRPTSHNPRARAPLRDAGQPQGAGGQHTRIGLPSNPTTGFAWSLDAAASTGLDHLDLVDGGFVATNSGLVGAPGRRWWTLTGRSSGRASLHFVYQRAWERDVPPAKARTIVIDVH